MSNESHSPAIDRGDRAADATMQPALSEKLKRFLKRLDNETTPAVQERLGN